MSTYVDSSGLLKRYVEEADSPAADALLRADAEFLTALPDVRPAPGPATRTLGLTVVTA